MHPCKTAPVPKWDMHGTIPCPAGSLRARFFHRLSRMYPDETPFTHPIKLNKVKALVCKGSNPHLKFCKGGPFKGKV